MKLRLLIIILVSLIAVYVPLSVNAGTEMNIYPNTNFAGGGTDVLFNSSTTQLEDSQKAFEDYVDNFFRLNDSVIPTAFVMVNTLGYPNGKATIKKFPHFEVGLAAGAGVLEYKRYDDYSEENPTVPFFGVNGGFHAGTGITNRLDFMVKFFTLGWIYKPDGSKETTDDSEGTTTDFKAEDAELYAYGIKFRYNIIPRATIVPLLFSFGGINFNLGFDYMQGTITTTELSIGDTELLTVDSDPLHFNNSGGSIKARAEYNTRGSTNWKLFSVTPELLVYSDFIYFFSLYMGPSASFNWGYLEFDVSGEGKILMEADDAGNTYEYNSNPVNPNTPLATMDAKIKYKMHPDLIIPKWTIGLEINVLLIKINLEAVSILTSPTDSAMFQFGLRVQI